MKKNLLLICMVLIASLLQLKGQTFDMSHESKTPFSNENTGLKIPSQISGPYLRSGQNAVFDIEYAGIWATEEKQAFEHAVKLWEDRMINVKGIKIKVSFENMDGLSESSFGIVTNYKNVATYHKSFVWWPAALVKHQVSNWEQLYPTLKEEFDIVIKFNGNKSHWYFGTDANPPSNKYDFVTIALRELTAGLGFKSSVKLSEGMPTYLHRNGAYLYDFFIKHMFSLDIGDMFVPSPKSQAFTNYITNKTATKVRFDSRHLTSGQSSYFFEEGLSYPTLYAPESFDNYVTANYFNIGQYNDPKNVALKYTHSTALMMPYIGRGSAVHHIGNCVLNVLECLGWAFKYPQQIPMEPQVFFSDGEDNYYGSSTLVTLEVYADGAQSCQIRNWEEGPGGIITNVKSYPKSSTEYQFAVDPYIKQYFEIKAINQYGESVYKTYTYIKYPSTYPPYNPPVNPPIGPPLIGPGLPPDMMLSSNPQNMVISFTDENGATITPQIQSVQIVNVTTPSLNKTVTNYVPGNAINMVNLPNGVYSVRAIDDKGNVYTEKTIK